MSSLTGSSISSTYDRLLSLPSGGGDTTNLVALTDGNGTTTFALQLSSAGIKSTGTLEVTGNADLNGTLDVAGVSTLTGLVTGSAGFTATAGNITATDGNLVITAADHGIIHTNSGTVTQTGGAHTSGVTLNTTSGIITLEDVALAAATNVEFTVTNSTVQADSVVIVSMQDENTTDNAQLTCATHTIGSGSFKITLHNPAATGATSTTASKIHFLVINNS
tara:strand:- start:54 stop:716 length:663 start_codon:yes stop_codon:yes gene_type:complete